MAAICNKQLATLAEFTADIAAALFFRMSSNSQLKAQFSQFINQLSDCPISFRGIRQTIISNVVASLFLEGATPRGGGSTATEINFLKGGGA